MYTITYTTQIERVYKKASSRVKLLSRICKNIGSYVAETIHKVIIEPVLFYCNNVMLGISDSTTARFQKIQDRAHKVVFGKEKGVTPGKQLPAKETDFVCWKLLNVLTE